jgi:tetratricopeptide (TPR) repeat protein/tRNA A-37 threonylcarbamoyl transferase component Bud32
MNEREIFMAALQQEGPVARRAFVEEACRGADDLRRGVEALLEAHEKAASFLEEPLQHLADTVAEACGERPGTLVGAYQLIEEIGEGGFGLVFLAEQQQPVRRRVALKVLKPGLDSREVIARFEAERQALALMDHPNIARVFDGGTTDGGRPYFVMELVRGVPITRYCDQNNLTPRARLELFLPVCQAVQHAHQKGVIHRDLKPSNLLVTVQDGVAVAKVIDFGIAKALGQQLTDKTLVTNFAQLIGTPLYMSPEQAGLSGQDVDTRSDIYSLGVLLYELLTGTTPFQKERFREAGYDEICRIIREEEPPRPSTRISTLGQAVATVSTHRQSDPKQLRRIIRGELDWIVMKALEKDRNRRYETASAFAADVERYLHDEPVVACPPSAWYRVKKLVRRNRVRLAAAVCLLLGSLTLAGVVGWAVRDRAVRQEKSVAAVRTNLDEARRLHQQGKRSEARAALQGAEVLLGSAPIPGELGEQCHRLRRDLDMLSRLEDLHFSRRLDVDLRLDKQAAAVGYTDAFAAYDLPVLDLEPEEAAARIEASAIAGDLVAGLVAWAICSEADRKKLLAVVRLADRDPWRQHNREAVLKGDWAQLAQQLRKPEALEQPPPTIVEFGRWLIEKDPPAAVALLRRAHRRHPNDYWINFELARALSAIKPPQLEEAIGFYRAAQALHPQSPTVHNNLGVAFFQQRKLAEAEEEFREALRLNPDFSEAHSNLGSVLEQQEKFTEAEAQHRLAIRLKGDYAAAHYNLGLALENQRKFAQAEDELRVAIRLEPKSPKAHTRLAWVLVEQGKSAQAERECRLALRLDADFANAHYVLGVTLTKTGRLAEGEVALRKAIALKADDPAFYCGLAVNLFDQRKFREAEAEFRRALGMKRKPVYHFNLGNALYEQNKLSEAAVEYRKALDLDPKYPSALGRLGKALYKQGKHREAAAAFEAALAINPNDPDGLNGRGMLLFEQRRFEEAKAAFQKAIACKPEFLIAYYNLAETLGKLQRVREAVIEYEKAIRLNPNNPETHYRLGVFFHGQGKRAEAMAAYRKVIDLQPGHAEAHNYLGDLWTQQGKLPQAEAEFRQAVKHRPGYVEAWIRLSSVLVRQGKLADAEAASRQATDLFRKLPADAPNVPLYRMNLARTIWHLGRSYAHGGKVNEAIAAVEKSMALDPENAALQNDAGTILAALGKLAEARAAFRKALALKPEFAGARDNLRRCEALIALDKKLSAVLRREAKPQNPRETAALASLAQQPYKRLHVAAVRLYRDAFAADPRLADPRTGNRYNAACSAALAGCGAGKDVKELDDAERARLREQALDWLRAELAAWGKVLDENDAKGRQLARRELAHWLVDADLAGVRGEALAKLPEGERQPWRDLWAAVEKTLAKAREKIGAEGKDEKKD